jgi:hypothetical protein
MWAARIRMTTNTLTIMEIHTRTARMGIHTGILMMIRMGIRTKTRLTHTGMTKLPLCGAGKD